MNATKLNKNFFVRPTITVAKELLGKLLIRRENNKITACRITEVEAYIGEDDLACHASKGRTPRSETLYHQPGTAYVYLIYGMYYLLNVVTEKENFPAAVLLRACEPIGKNLSENSLVGPGRLCRTLNITKEIHGQDLTKSDKLWFADDGYNIPESKICSTPRIGVDYAKHCANYPWRFFTKDSEAVSKTPKIKNRKS